MENQFSSMHHSTSLPQIVHQAFLSYEIELLDHSLNCLIWLISGLFTLYQSVPLKQGHLVKIFLKWYTKITSIVAVTEKVMTNISQRTIHTVDYSLIPSWDSESVASYLRIPELGHLHKLPHLSCYSSKAQTSCC